MLFKTRWAKLLASLLLGVFVLAGGAGWAEETDTWAGSPGQAQYPDANALVLLDHIDYTVNKDGTTVLSEHEVIKILNEEGQGKYRLIMRNYNLTRQEMQVDLARIIKKDGTTASLEPGKEITRDARLSKDLPHCKDEMLLTLDYSRAEVGDIIEFKLRFITRKPFIDRYFWSLSYTNDEVPLLLTRFTVNMMKDGDRLRWFAAGLQGDGAKPVETATPGGRHLKWELKNRPPAPEEPSAPSFRDRVSYILVSTCPTWKDLSMAYHGLLKSCIEPDQKVREKVRSLTGKLKDPQEKLSEISDFVNGKKIVGWDFEPDHLGLFKPGELLSAEVITKQDSAILFLSMARAAGLEVLPILIADQKHGRVYSQLPTPYQFNNILVRVKVGQEWKIIDPSQPLGRSRGPGSMYEGRTYLVLKPGGADLAVTPLSPPSANREEIITDARFMADGSMGANMRFVETGNKRAFWKSFLDIMKASNSERMVFAKMLTLISPEARLLTHTIDDDPRSASLEVEMTFMAEGYPQVSGDYLILKLPTIPMNRTEFLAKDSSGRKTPVVMGSTSQDIKRFTLSLPGEVTVVSLPQGADIRNRVGSLKADCRQEADKIVFTFDLQIFKDVVPVEEFPELMQLYEKSLDITNQVIILKKK